MNIPYGFDCYAFAKDQVKYFESNLYSERSGPLLGRTGAAAMAPLPTTAAAATKQDFVKFTRKNEDYPKEQLLALCAAGRLNLSEIDKRVFCGIKVQIGISVVTNFMRKGLMYKPPIAGRSELKNGTWTGIMKGLTVEKSSPISYDLAFGNFLAWDVEFPYINFGPFVAVESKLLILTGSSRRVEQSSFGANITREIWLAIVSLLLVLSILASFRLYKQQLRQEKVKLLAIKYGLLESRQQVANKNSLQTTVWHLLKIVQDFFFIYFTMLLNKPSVEFDNLIWPKHCAHKTLESTLRKKLTLKRYLKPSEEFAFRLELETISPNSVDLFEKRGENSKRPKQKLPSSIRALSYTWSAAALVMASIFSGEMLAVMLLHTDQNIDTIAQLIQAKPTIEPVIRQDDFTYALMLRSLDENMLKLSNKTRMIPRGQVYTEQFIESVSQRKQALLGDDELIETIYDIYHKYYPLYKSKMSYLQYPISIIYRKDLDSNLESKLRTGIVQTFEMGLINRWYQAQKDTYMGFYDSNERRSHAKQTEQAASGSDQNNNYKPLSIYHFVSFFRAMFLCGLFAFLVLLAEIGYSKLTAGRRSAKVGHVQRR